MTVRAQLNRLEGDGLIQVAITQPELEYLFRHGPIRDAAYFSLVKGDRRALHLAEHITDAAQRAAFLERAERHAPTGTP